MLMIIIFVVSLITAFTWGIFLETSLILNQFYFAWHFRNNFALVTYSLSALLLALLSLGVFYFHLRKSNWSVLQKYLYYIGVIISTLFIITGFEFVLFGEWNLYQFFWLTDIKYLLILVLLIMLMRFWSLEGKDDSTEPEQEN